MPEQVVDEVVNTNPRTAPARGVAARPVVEETVGGPPAPPAASADETHAIADRRGRAFKPSTSKLLEKIEAEEQAAKAAAPDEGDPDEDEPDDADEGDADEGDADEGDADEGDADGGDADEGDGTDGDADEGDADEEKPDPAAALAEERDRLLARNREMVAELEAARKAPKAKRTERETALIAAESKYYDEGTIPALRQFLSVVTGAPPDSKEVDAELAGLYTDLTARELGVGLDPNQQALRDNARTRLLLARDKREKAEAGKTDPDDSAEVVNYEEGTKHVTALLSTKTQNGASLKDEYPTLMALAEDFDGYAPSEVVARTIRHEIMTGTLDPKVHSDVDMVRHAASKIEKYYASRAAALRAKLTPSKKPDTTTPSGKKPKVAVEASNAQRQSTGAPTITNATASRAPAKNPKPDQKAPTTKQGRKTRKDFPSDAAWRNHLLDKHFKS